MSENKVKHIHGNIFMGPGKHVEELVRQSVVGRDGLGSELTIGVLNVADDYPEMEHHRDILYVHAGLNDHPADWEQVPWEAPNSPTAYLNAIKALDFLVDTNKAVYVHCHSGKSRSCFIVCLYLSWIFDESFEKTMNAVRERYDLVKIHPKHIAVLPHLQELMPLAGMSRCPLWWREKMGPLVKG